MKMTAKITHEWARAFLRDCALQQRLASDYSLWIAGHPQPCARSTEAIESTKHHRLSWRGAVDVQHVKARMDAWQDLGGIFADIDHFLDTQFLIDDAYVCGSHGKWFSELVSSLFGMYALDKTPGWTGWKSMIMRAYMRAYRPNVSDHLVWSDDTYWGREHLLTGHLVNGWPGHIEALAGCFERIMAELNKAWAKGRAEVGTAAQRAANDEADEKRIQRNRKRREKRLAKKQSVTDETAEA